MNAIDALPPLREVIARHGLNARKELGQNFLFDLNLTGRIARTAGDLSQATVIEIGPGPGGLTRALLSAGAKRLIAIERDERTLPALAEIAAAWPGKLDIVSADALEVDYSGLAEGPVKIVANLPYNIATPLLTGWLAVHHLLLPYTLMLAVHILSVELLMVVFPFTKLTHAFTLFLSRWYNGAISGYRGVES